MKQGYTESSIVQFSINKPSTLENSPTLCVINVPLFARTVAAIIMSFGPIMIPFDDKIFLSLNLKNTSHLILCLVVAPHGFLAVYQA